MAMSNRYFANPGSPCRTVDPGTELRACLGRITRLHPPVHTCSTNWSFSGLYAGPTSVALLFYRLAALYPDLELGHQSLLDWAQSYLQLGARVPHRPPSPSHCGVGDETLAHLALTAVVSGDASLAHRLCAYADVINDPADDGSNEWLYGRAGYLYLLRLCRRVFPGDPLDRTIAATARRMLAVPRPWVWHGREYLGAVHGSVGIVAQIVLSVPSLAPRLQAVVAGLLDTQLPSGNFPSSRPAGSDRLVQFCHGGPGFVVSLCAVLPCFPALADRIGGAIARARSDVWERGLLTKEPCLCHGIAGNSLALEGDERFVHFLSFMGGEGVDGGVGSSAGLFTGEAGRAWCWAVADRGLDRTVIGFNDV
ncbi:hypothetical protein F4861DRAFT_284795 [Xylaria intraflava]|nr:hypothetical protein F4861DRAFT_284795 [Xylaria intraflava]